MVLCKHVCSYVVVEIPGTMRGCAAWSLLSRHVLRDFHVSQWSKANKSSAVRRTAAGKSHIDREKVRLFSTTKYGGSPRRAELAHSLRVHRDVGCLSLAVGYVEVKDIFYDGHELDLEFYALYLNGCFLGRLLPALDILRQWIIVSEKCVEDATPEAISSILAATSGLLARTPACDALSGALLATSHVAWCLRDRLCSSALLLLLDGFCGGCGERTIDERALPVVHMLASAHLSPDEFACFLALLCRLCEHGAAPAAADASHVLRQVPGHLSQSSCISDMVNMWSLVLRCGSVEEGDVVELADTIAQTIYSELELLPHALLASVALVCLGAPSWNIRYRKLPAAVFRLLNTRSFEEWASLRKQWVDEVGAALASRRCAALADRIPVLHAAM